MSARVATIMSMPERFDLPLALLTALAFSLPLEFLRPWLALGPIVLTNLELLLLLVLAAGAWRTYQAHRAGESVASTFGLPRAWLLLWAAVTAGALIAALLAPAAALGLPGLQLNALKAAGRTIAGLGLALAVPPIVGSPGRARWPIAGLLAGALLTIGLGLIEVWREVPLSLLDPLRAQPTTVGPFLRLTASYDHANQAAMAIEAALPLLLVATWSAWDAGRRAVSLILAALALLAFQGLLLTYGRAGLVTALLVNGLIIGFLWRRAAPGDRRGAARWAGATVLALALAAGNTLTDPVWGLRLRSEDDRSWYVATIEAPDRLALQSGQTVNVDLVLRNQGALTWVSAGDNPIQIGARWHREDGDRLAVEPRWPLASYVRPGQTMRQTVALTAPPAPGVYELTWDMVQERITWFGEKTGRQTLTEVTVAGAAAAIRPAPSAPEATPAVTPAPIPSRGRLWRIVGQALSRFPWTGLGLDNFRLAYGRFLPSEAWNPTIHTNNWYLETLVSLGLLGAAPFLVWLVWLVVDLARVLRRRPKLVWGLGVAGGLLAFVVHGLLDYFLMFNSTALLFWLLVGLWLALRAPRELEV